MELFDIYDINKKNTGRTMDRENAFLREGEFQLIVLAIIERSDKKFLITQRSMEKSWAAGSWEVSGGGVQSGETSQEAVIREIGEEAGLKVSIDQGKLIYSYSNVNLERGDNYIVDIYHFVVDFCDEDVKLQDSEAIDFDIVPFERITELENEGKFLHYKRICEALEAEKNSL